MAANFGQLSMVQKLLVTGGADDTLTDDSGNTALYYAEENVAGAWESFKREATAARVERARQVMNS